MRHVLTLRIVLKISEGILPLVNCVCFFMNSVRLHQDVHLSCFRNSVLLFLVLCEYLMPFCCFEEFVVSSFR